MLRADLGAVKQTTGKKWQSRAANAKITALKEDAKAPPSSAR
jgi:hypothetical protein